MARNKQLSERTTNDIDKRVARILNDLGNPKPPLDLAQVRELLELNRSFYSLDDPSLLAETVNRIRVATIQVFSRPTLLVEAIQSLSLKALYIPDQRRILLDASAPQKHRWSEAHEIGHSIIPWHAEMMHGDTQHTLSLDCHQQIEAEANYAAGRLLFMEDNFGAEINSGMVSFETIHALKSEFQNTMTSTLWRVVEVAGTLRPIFGLVSAHPHPSKTNLLTSGDSPCRHLIASQAFSRMFSNVSEHDLFMKVRGYCSASRGGPLGSAEIEIEDSNGEMHVFQCETFFNSYDALTLGVHRGKSSIIF